jgi:hypothetical protein
MGGFDEICAVIVIFLAVRVGSNKNVPAAENIRLHAEYVPGLSGDQFV